MYSVACACEQTKNLESQTNNCDNDLKMSGRRVWKISAGEKSKYRDDFIEGGFAALGEWDEGDVNKYAGSKSRLIKRIKHYSLKKWPERYKEGSTFGYQLWDFYNELDENDSVVLYGQGVIYAIGKINGAYWYDEKAHVERQYPHRVPVLWKVAKPPIKNLSDVLHNCLTKPSNTFHEIKKEKCIEEINGLSNSDLLKDIPPVINNGTSVSDAELIKELETIQGDLRKKSRKSTRFQRNRELVIKLKELYNFRCQLCSPDAPEIPLIPMPNERNYVEVHHIKGFNEIDDVKGEYSIDHFRNTITVCCYHHKLLHKYRSKFTYDYEIKIFRTKDGERILPLLLNKHL